MKPMLFFMQHFGFQTMSHGHGASCGCGFCHTVSRLVGLVTDPRRDPRLVQVATTRVRVLHSLLLDLVDGVSYPLELGGDVRLTDPGAPPGTGDQPSGGVPLLEHVGLPVVPGPKIPGLAFVPPRPSLPVPPPPPPPLVLAKLPDQGTRKEKKRSEKEKDEEKPAETPRKREKELEKVAQTSQSRERQRRREEKKRQKKEKSKSVSRHRRKKDKKSRSRSRRRSISRKDLSNVAVKVEPSEREEAKRELEEVLEEIPSEEKEEARGSRDRKPCPPRHPPPGYSGRAEAEKKRTRPVYRPEPRREYRNSEKGVKKKDRNRRFYEQRVLNRQYQQWHKPRYWGSRRR